MATSLAQSASLFNRAALARNPLELTVKVLEAKTAILLNRAALARNPLEEIVKVLEAKKRAALFLLFCNNWVIIEHRFFLERSLPNEQKAF